MFGLLDSSISWWQPHAGRGNTGLSILLRLFNHAFVFAADVLGFRQTGAGFRLVQWHSPSLSSSCDVCASRFVYINLAAPLRVLALDFDMIYLRKYKQSLSSPHSSQPTSLVCTTGFSLTWPSPYFYGLPRE
jgi:hypothetical protein